MIVKLSFNKPELVSAGSNRDILAMKISNPKYFFSKELLSTISLNATSEIVIPKMTADTSFAQSFEAASEHAVDFTNVSLVSSFLVNLVLSGPMSLLWGLVNSLQIVTHFPLISVMMPSNAYKLLIVIV